MAAKTGALLRLSSKSMGTKLNQLCGLCTPRLLSSLSQKSEERSFKLVVVGGGTGGSAIAHKFCGKLGGGKVAVIEPSLEHYNQPLWTLVGGGLKNFEECVGYTKDVLPSKCVWIQDKAMIFDPENCTVVTANGDVIKYEILVVAMGMQPNFHLVKGLPEALNNDPNVVSNYCYNAVKKTWPAIQNFKSGNAIFTFPNTSIKCAGAPQKIMYIAEDYFRETGIRDKANIMYNTALGRLFGVPKYTKTLMKIVEERNIKLNFRHNLIEVRPDKSEAVFEKIDPETSKPNGETVTMDYSLLHVGPPMSTPDALRESPLVNPNGFVTVNKETLQHTKYPNIFAIGDNTNKPNGKTAAAVASQVRILNTNLDNFIQGKELSAKYDGYASCPLVTRRNKVVMAEFDFNMEPMETFPFDQSKERTSMFLVKNHLLAPLYWNALTKGRWHGPKLLRKIFHLGMTR